MADTPATEVKKTRALALMPERFGVAEYKRNDFVANVESHVTKQDLLEPGFWAHVSGEMQPFDQIQVRPDDGSWVAYLIVLFAERNYARVIMDRFIEVQMNTQAPRTSIKYMVDYKGTQKKWSVIRTADAAIVHEGEASRENAENWMRNHEKAMI